MTDRMELQRPVSGQRVVFPYIEGSRESLECECLK